MKANVIRLVFGAALAMASVAPVSFAQYVRTDLATNRPGAAPSTDQQHLINSWGLTALPASPFWLSDNGSGFSTLYSGAGVQSSLFVSIPPAPGSPAGTLGTPTGTVGNIGLNKTDFVVTENGKSAKSLFIFSTLDGTISAWNPAVDGITPDPSTGNLLSHTTVMAQGPHANTSYTGLAIATNDRGETFLFAADGGPNRAIDVFGSDFSYKTSLSDPAIPKEFATYGIQEIDGQIWVTFTPLNKALGGFVDVFGFSDSSSSGFTLLRHNVLRGPLHSPWGIAKAPADFGPMSGAILISNNTAKGQILAFNPDSGQFLGELRDANGKAIEVDGIWALQFGKDGGPNGTHKQLFFTGGPTEYADGVFGMITVGQ